MSDDDQKKAWNEKAGLRLQQLAYNHSIFWTYNNFLTSISAYTFSDTSSK